MQILLIETPFGTSKVIFEHPITIIAGSSSPAAAEATAVTAMPLPPNWAPTAAPPIALPVPAYTPSKMQGAAFPDLGPPPPYEVAAAISSGMLSPSAPAAVDSMLCSSR